MDKTKIDWCDSTWNPVTGCLHGCEYCYARGIANRFGGWEFSPGSLRLNVADEKTYIAPIKAYYGEAKETEYGKIAEINDQFIIRDKKAPYPFGFMPTFHRYRLNEYTDKKGRNIFVCSMADLFGAWVPDDWKIEVLDACRKAPQHNYLFLTKDPIGYSIWPTKKYKNFHEYEAYTENMWLGVTYTGRERLEGHYQDWEIGHSLSIWTNFWYLWRMSDTILPNKAHKFISIEPLWCDICEVEDEREGGKLLENFLLPRGYKSFFEWIIVGAETGKRKDKVIPKREWIEKLVDLCKKAEIPIFMKSSLAEIWGEQLIQEFPEQLMRNK